MWNVDCFREYYRGDMIAGMKLPKAYEPGKYEPDIYALWEKSGVFKADPESKKEKFSISFLNFTTPFWKYWSFSWEGEEKVGIEKKWKYNFQCDVLLFF